MAHSSMVTPVLSVIIALLRLLQANLYAVRCRPLYISVQHDDTVQLTRQLSKLQKIPETNMKLGEACIICATTCSEQDVY